MRRADGLRAEPSSSPIGRRTTKSFVHVQLCRAPTRRTNPDRIGIARMRRRTSRERR
eukprot:CAMPEP_0197462424 /NCGR_PEP_ID=MMETSP1175-20131217/59065_1 /TAXON_ID=1003142 /ORGANISM="Triceratium dubium, Strain CCMP147" /LENGTH=56 /DNA_ID=CAMNT_0042997929 /DNA_START=61 /DNA_END=228 /DNA_ORIENTATION=+